jgi:hypothetical protein
MSFIHILKVVNSTIFEVILFLPHPVYSLKSMMFPRNRFMKIIFGALNINFGNKRNSESKYYRVRKAGK